MPLQNGRRDLIAQRRLTREQGEYVTLYPVVLCSCKGATDGHPDPTCKVCGGAGRTYRQHKRLRALVAGVSAQDKILLQAGVAMPGDLTLSPEVAPGLAIHDHDMIRLDYAMPYEGDTIKRGEDRLLYLAKKITDLEQHDPISGIVTRYQEGADYTFSGPLITWLAGRGPAYASSYSVKYEALFDWVVYPGVTLPRMTRGTALGQRVLLRKRHLAGIPAILPD